MRKKKLKRKQQQQQNEQINSKCERGMDCANLKMKNNKQKHPLKKTQTHTQFICIENIFIKKNSYSNTLHTSKKHAKSTKSINI